MKELKVQYTQDAVMYVWIIGWFTGILMSMSGSLAGKIFFGVVSLGGYLLILRKLRH